MHRLLWIVAAIWELLYKGVLIKAQFIRGSEHRLIRVSYRPYSGADVTIGGKLITKGDPIGEVHLSNMALARYRGKPAPEMAIYKDFLSELSLLSADLKHNEYPIKALCGITLLAPILKKMGFTIVEMPPDLWRHIVNVWLRILRRAFTPQKSDVFRSLSTQRKPVQFWILTEQFIERFSESGKPR